MSKFSQVYGYKKIITNTKIILKIQDKYPVLNEKKTVWKNNGSYEYTIISIFKKALDRSLLRMGRSINTKIIANCNSSITKLTALRENIDTL